MQHRTDKNNAFISRKHWQLTDHRSIKISVNNCEAMSESFNFSVNTKWIFTQQISLSSVSMSFLLRLNERLNK